MNPKIRQAAKMPIVGSGQKVGLFGGSFNPPHAGHIHVCEQALRRLELDWIWWLVTPGNPLKDTSNLAPLPERLDLCEAIATDPRMKVTAIEAGLSSRYTVDTLEYIVTRNPDVNFVWIMGADNLGQFHRWDRWCDIAALVPIAVVDRPGSTMALHSAPAAHVLRHERVAEDDATRLPTMPAPAWTFLHGPRSSLSSTAIRAAKKAQTQKSETASS